MNEIVCQTERNDARTSKSNFVEQGVKILKKLTGARNKKVNIIAQNPRKTEQEIKLQQEEDNLREEEKRLKQIEDDKRVVVRKLDFFVSTDTNLLLRCANSNIHIIINKMIKEYGIEYSTTCFLASGNGNTYSINISVTKSDLDKFEAELKERINDIVSKVPVLN